jgi:hypothetical protein
MVRRRIWKGKGGGMGVFRRIEDIGHYANYMMKPSLAGLCWMREGAEEKQRVVKRQRRGGT